jgi:hypothetical protein
MSSALAHYGYLTLSFSFHYLSSLDAEKMPHLAEHLSDTCLLCILTRSGVIT